MGGKVYDIDAALNAQRPHFRLRGETYRCVDLPLEERLRREAAYREMGDALIAKEEQGETITSDEWARYKIMGVALVLENVPDEIAAELTEYEFDALREANRTARRLKIVVEATEGN